LPTGKKASYQRLGTGNKAIIVSMKKENTNMDENIIGAEVQEAADPVETDANDIESAETQEVAEPVGNETEAEKETVEANEPESGSTDDADAAFAEMRRNNAELAKQNAAMEEALRLYFDGENGEDLSVEARAFAEKRNPEEIKAELEEQARVEDLRQENERLSQELQDAQAEKFAESVLSTVKKIDPNIKTEDDLNKLGEPFINLVVSGIDPETAYYAVQAKNYSSKVNAPRDIGKVGSTAVDRDYYTSDELDKLSKDEISKNWDKVEKSMKRL